MEAKGRSRPLVLAVDDDVGFRSALSLVLADTYEVLEASDAPTALNLLARRAVDLVLLDVLMPRMGGLALLERLRAATPHLPVILVTALDEARTAVAAMKLGAFDYLTKPFDVEQLLTVVRRALEARGTGAPKIVLMGGAVGTRASLAVLLRVWWRVEIPAAEADLGAAAAAAVSDVAVVDISTPGGTDLAWRVRARTPHARLIVINADGPSAFIGPGWEGCRAFRRPLRVSELFDEVVTLLPLAYDETRCPQLSALVGRVVDHVIGHFPDSSVEQVARALALSPDRLSRLFRETTRLTLKSFLNKIRMEAAKCLLAETDEKVESLAERLGLHGAAHLSRLFVQHCGERPGSYRRAVARLQGL